MLTLYYNLDFDAARATRWNYYTAAIWLAVGVALVLALPGLSRRVGEKLAADEGLVETESGGAAVPADDGGPGRRARRHDRVLRQQRHHPSRTVPVSLPRGGGGAGRGDDDAASPCSTRERRDHVRATRPLSYAVRRRAAAGHVSDRVNPAGGPARVRLDVRARQSRSTAARSRRTASAGISRAGGGARGRRRPRGARGLRARVGRWSYPGDDPRRPAHQGAGHGPLAMLQVDEFCARLLSDLDANGIVLGQFHAEYGVAQMELSLAPSDPVSTADLQLLTRQTIHAAARATGLRASFAPLVDLESVGNGWHLHTSVLRKGTNLLSGGDGPAGMTPEGEAWVAGLLRELPALAAVGGPSLPSQIRRRPGYFAGAYAFWGVLNREAALRFVPASAYVPPQGANVELKASDASGNPYLLLAAVIGAGLAGMADGLGLPEGIEADPGAWERPGAGHPRRRAPAGLDRGVGRRARGLAARARGARSRYRRGLDRRSPRRRGLRRGQDARGDRRVPPLQVLRC